MTPMEAFALLISILLAVMELTFVRIAALSLFAFTLTPTVRALAVVLTEPTVVVATSFALPMWTAPFVSMLSTFVETAAS